MIIAWMVGIFLLLIFGAVSIPLFFTKPLVSEYQKLMNDNPELFKEGDGELTSLRLLINNQKDIEALNKKLDLLIEQTKSCKQ